MSTERPYHIEAAELGADIRAIRERFGRLGIYHPQDARHVAAAEIAAVWDYRAAGLRADEARRWITRWITPTYHWPALYANTASSGRISRLAAQVRALRAAYAAAEADVERRVWRCGGRELLTRTSEDVIWSGNPRHHWPTSRRVEHTTYLLRADWRTTPHARVLLGLGALQGDLLVLHAAVEATISHTQRGAWRARVARELGLALPGPGEPPLDGVRIGYKRVAVTPDGYRSVFDGVTTYAIGSITTAQAVDAARHQGLFVRATPAGAATADVPADSVLHAAPSVVLKCLVWGRHWTTETKHAYEHCMPVEVVAE